MAKKKALPTVTVATDKKKALDQALVRPVRVVTWQ